MGCPVLWAYFLVVHCPASGRCLPWQVASRGRVTVSSAISRIRNKIPGQKVLCVVNYNDVSISPQCVNSDD